jgi:hypothetical protein
MVAPSRRALLFTRTDFDLRGRGSMDEDLRERLSHWATSVQERLAELGLALELAVVDGKLGPPGVVFVRSSRQREQALKVARAQKLDYRPLFAGVFAENAKLQLRLTHATVEARLELPASALVDIHNLRAKMKNPEGLLAVTSVVEALPEQFWAGVEGGSQGPVSRITGRELREWVDEAVGLSATLFFGWTLPKDLAVAQKAEIGGLLEDAFSALGSLYDTLAWSETNDFFSGQKRRARPESPREGAKSKRSRKGRRPKDEPFVDEGEPVSTDDSPAPSDAAQSQKANRADPLFLRKRPILRRAPQDADTDPKLPIEKGTRICVLRGPFSGKVGVVQELDGKGGARVLFGLLAARLRVSDLVAFRDRSGKNSRQKLMSSHRRPLGGVSSK